MMGAMTEKLSSEKVFEGSLRQVARHWVFFLGVGLAQVVLYLPVTLFAERMAFHSEGPAETMAMLYIIYVFNAMVACLIYGTVIDFARQASLGPRPSVAQALKMAVRRWPALVWTMIVRWFWLILGFILLLVPGIIWGYRQMLCWVVTMVEGISGPAALRRAQALMRVDPDSYSIAMVQWFVSLLLAFGINYAVTYAVLKQPTALRIGVQWGVGIFNWMIFGVAYFSMVRVYGYLRDKLDGTPEPPEVGFSPSFEL